MSGRTKHKWVSKCVRACELKAKPSGLIHIHHIERDTYIFTVILLIIIKSSWKCRRENFPFEARFTIPERECEWAKKRNLYMLFLCMGRMYSCSQSSRYFIIFIYCVVYFWTWIEPNQAKPSGEINILTYKWWSWAMIAWFVAIFQNGSFLVFLHFILSFL